VRKIISILVALGLVLAFSAVAMPTSAANTCNGTVEITDICASAEATYTINFTAPVTLTPGNDLLSVTFGAGTSLAGVNASDVTVVLPAAGSPTSVTISGNHIEFPIPGAALIFAGTSVSVVIDDVVNPPGGDYNLVLDYKLVCCPAVDFCTVAYHINLAINTYSLMVDFGDTYPGIAQDFVPPFKACGQNSTGQDFITTYDPVLGGFWEPFDLIVKSELAGCNPPCVNATLFVDLVATASASAKVSLNISGEIFTLNSTSHNGTLAAPVVLVADADTSLQSAIHFNTLGKGYQIYFKLYCPATGVPTCANNCTSGSPTIVAEKTYTFDVYQWKDAAKLILDEKWNLISLPLVPLVDPPIATLLASIPAADRAQILSIHNFDCVTETWKVWGNGQISLTELVDGKAYWVKLTYPQTDCGNITWWVWGTEKPMPPASPAQYPVCEGWNMVGYLGTTAMNATGTGGYLWNWATWRW